ncbi:hypothetical protein FA13DRAFT_1708118 [Coprinellus micaceus]|uniref:Uncharacterized protein n=1 Tax=Coprinellus micaceus TaxID=71717 RepID=A0A4Y7TIZ5_COPMI|nr:hypothetical protein FA13DRAFT_1708114 [Coprinellus micaceus]TEB33954.1 hypothetical protein FA13DRAFT_1708118 [Coprinellus micaceus]
MAHNFFLNGPNKRGDPLRASAPCRALAAQILGPDKPSVSQKYVNGIIGHVIIRLAGCGNSKVGIGGHREFMITRVDAFSRPTGLRVWEAVRSLRGALLGAVVTGAQAQ